MYEQEYDPGHSRNLLPPVFILLFHPENLVENCELILPPNKEVIFSPVSVCLSVCLLAGLLKTNDQIFMKSYGMAGRNAGTNRLEFGADPAVDPGTRNFLKEFYHCDTSNAPHRGIGNSRKIRRLADLRFNELKIALAKVCALRLLLIRI